MALATRRGAMKRLVCLLSAVVLATACTDATDLADIDEVEVGEEDLEGKADEDSELRVRTGETTIWMTKQLSRRDGANGPEFVLRGRASRNITRGFAFINDDVYGEYAHRSARTFEVTWPVSTARGLLDGVDQFIRTSFTPSAGRPETLFSRVVVRPRFTTFTGSSSVYLTAELTPVVRGGAVVYRAKGRSTSAITSVAATVNGVSLTDVRVTDPTHFEIDLAPDHAFAIAGVSATSARLSITATRVSGGTVEKHARLGVAIKKLGVTAEDPYEKWPRPTCTSDVSACLASLPAGGVDTAACGEAIVVLACAGQAGAVVDDVALQAAISQAAARTSAAAFRADAAALVGAARVDAFTFGTQQTAEHRLEQLFGTTYPNAASRDAALSTAIDSAIHDAYARPLDLVDPVTPAAGNTAAIRQVAADALLQALTAYDFVDSELARTYDALVDEYRAQHVASIRAFRETADIEAYPGRPDLEVLIGNWLGTYVEVSITKATGAASNVYIEID